MKSRLLVKAGAAAIAVALAGFLFAWSGLFNVGASTGHWAITAWFLHFAMHNSVETHAMGIEEAPALDDPALVLKGAGHYEQGCAPCHGTPGNAPNPVVRKMTPPPPHLGDRIERWTPEELFWIVKHGVKFTAMPAWPAQDRDDEVWAMTAFLLRFPELSAVEYRRLAYGEITGEGETTADAVLGALANPLGPILANCARCHGYDGSGRGEGAFPILNGQKEAYLYESLKSYAAGERFSGMMQLAASGLSHASMAGLARHYATTGRTESSAAGRGAMRRGPAEFGSARPTQPCVGRVRRSPIPEFPRRGYRLALPAMARRLRPATRCIRCWRVKFRAISPCNSLCSRLERGGARPTLTSCGPSPSACRAARSRR